MSDLVETNGRHGHGRLAADVGCRQLVAAQGRPRPGDGPAKRQDNLGSVTTQPISPAAVTVVQMHQQAPALHGERAHTDMVGRSDLDGWRRVALDGLGNRPQEGGALLDGARAALERHGVKDEDVAVTWVPGSFEIPLVARTMALSGDYDAIVCLGAVIRGETAHFDYVAGETASGIARTSLESGVPVIFGVLTTDTVEQAINRAGGKSGNKGYEHAVAAIEMANLMRQLKG